MTSLPSGALLALLASGLLSSFAATQDAPPKPAPSPIVAPAKQDKPEPPAQSAQDVLNPLAELQATLERAKVELEATRRLGEAGGLPGVVKHYFSDRQLEARSVRVAIKPTPQPVAGEAPKPPVNTARLMTANEKAVAGEEVVATVNGEPIKKAEVDAMFKYYRQSPEDLSDDEVTRRALRAVITQKGALASFQANAVERKQRIDGLRAQIAGGADFAEVARKNSQCPSAAQGGDLGLFQKGMMDPMFEKAAFELKLGEISDVIQSSFGYHILKATGYEKGETPSQDKVRASHILVMFDDDQGVVRNKMADLMRGNCELAFRDENWKKLNPFGN